MATIFTKIIEGEIPAHIVYEDEKVIAIMDVNPIQPGHVLVISKKEIPSFEQLEDEDYHALMAAVKKVAEKIREVINPIKVGVIIEGFEVPHTHVKVLPINSEAELRHLPSTDEAPGQDELAAMAEKLKIE